jgi:hypothetical protein
MFTSQNILQRITMSSNRNKAIAIGAVIILVAACVISGTAQAPSAVNRLTAKTHSISEKKEIEVEKKSVPQAESTDPASGSTESPTARRPDEERTEPGTPKPSSPQSSSDTWQFQFTPYLWIPTISGRAGIGNRVIDTTTSIGGDSDVEINFGVMGTFEARKDKLIFLTDLQYSDLASEKGNPGPFFSSTRASFKTFVLDPEIGYRLLDNGKGATIDVLGGIRVWHLNANLAFRAGILPAVEVSRSRGWVDGVVGLRGKAALSQRWFVTGKADLGGGGSKFTYQLFGGVGVNVGKRFAFVGGYRDLNVNYDKDGFLFDMSLHGPIFGVGMKF